jgi:actin-like ATPase involved in cell morphogenesis
MHKIRILTVSDSTPVAVLDKVLTAAEDALEAAGAQRVWVESESMALAVMAELPVAQH